MKYDIKINHYAGYSLFEVEGVFTHKESSYLLETIHREIEEKSRFKFIVDIRKLDLTALTEFERYKIGEKIANTFGGKYKVAVVMIENEYNGYTETVAVNRGTNYKVFFSMEKAKKWILPFLD